MKVTLIAKTDIVSFPQNIRETNFGQYDISEEALSDKDADTLAHFAGRSCYQSWAMPNEKTATNMGYMANILNQQHYSIMEHASATFYIEGVSRNLTHELIRHRHLSYSELSQRYINMEDAVIIIPPAVDNLKEEWIESASRYGRVMADSIDQYNEIVDTLDRAGIKGKKAREAARALLPGGTETKIVVTGNHRAWRDMLHKRYSIHADAEICELAIELLRQLRLIAPATYQDFPDQPFE